MRDYCAAVEAEHDRASTIRHKKEAAKRWERWVKGRELAPRTLQDFRLYIATKTDSNPTRNLWLSNTSSYLKWLMAGGYITAITEADVKRILRKFPVGRELVQILSQDEIRRVVVEAGEYRGKYPVGCLVLAALVTGARRGELTGLGIRDIDPDNQKIILSGSKGRQPREFPFELMGCASKLFREVKRTMRRFVWEQRAWETIRERAGVPSVKFKTFRACFSSYAKSAGANPWLIDQFLGHTAQVAKSSYDRALVGITGDNAPQWYGCEDAFQVAVERVQFFRG